MTTDASIVRHVTFGRQRVSRIEPRVRLDAGGTRLRLRALHVMGHGSARIARALGTSEDTIQRLVAATPAPSARNYATRSLTCTTRGGTKELPSAPGPSVPLPPVPAAAPPPGTGARPPP